MTVNHAASIHARLLARARVDGEDFNLLLTRFALERLLFRLSVSRHVPNFLLKGALLFALWYDQSHRPTRDADLLGFGPDDSDTLAAVFHDVCDIVADDGMVFDSETVAVAAIRDENEYGGLRVTLTGRLGNARIPIQIDIGFGDAVTPAPERITYPVLIADFPAPELRAYPVYTVVAEKYQAMVMLGMANSRMKDFFDLYVIAKTTALEGTILVQAIAATFERRRSALPVNAKAIALTKAFWGDKVKQTQWEAFLKRNRLDSLSFDLVAESLTAFLMPPTRALLEGVPFTASWQPGGPWRTTP